MLRQVHADKFKIICIAVMALFTASSLQQLSVVLIQHRVPEVKSFLFRIDSHRQLVCDVQVGDVHVRAVAGPRNGRPQYRNVIVVAGTYRGIAGRHRERGGKKVSYGAFNRSRLVDKC